MPAQKGNRYAAKYDEGEMEKICEKLLYWAENSKSIHFSNFCRKELGKSKRWLLETSEHYPILKETIEEARDIIAGKMVDSCFREKENGVNASFGIQYLPIYDKDFRELLKWKAEISKEEKNKEESKGAFNKFYSEVSQEEK